MANRDFLKNRNINEGNSLLDLVQNISPDSEDAVNFTDHSIYYNDQNYKECIARSNGALRILNLNCGGLNAKFDNLKFFLAECNNTMFPLHVITLQETHINSNSDILYFDLPGYTLVYDLARINTFGGVAIYVHDSFSFNRLDTVAFKQNSTVYESMYLEIYNKDASFYKYIIGSVYRRPSELLDDLKQFIEEFSITLSSIHSVSKQAYINGDYNIDLLQLHTNTHYNTFYENTTAQGFFPKITRPTRSHGSSHKLIDNVFTNNLCKRHTSGILTHQISDHFMTFSIVEGNIKQIKNPVKYVEVQNINPASINNFKNSIATSDLLSQLDLNVNANPNVNYNLLSSVLEQAKIRHIPKKIQRFNRRKHCIEPWMNKELLTLINKKNDKYRDWKSTNNDIEYETKKINFKTFERIVKENIKEAKRDYYFKTFTAHKHDLRKTWRTIDDTLNKKSNKSKFPSKFIVNNRTVTDHKKIADEFNNFFSNIGSTLSASIKLDDSTIAFTDYLGNPTEHRFSFSKITENETLTIINNLKSKNSSVNDDISNRLLKSIKCEISKPLTIIINQSLETGIFPNALKVAKVKPLFKKGDNCCLNNYRPISLLPTISKIFERVMYTQLYYYFNVNNFLSEQQYSFRSQHSTELASVKLVDFILKEMDNIRDIKIPAFIFLDLSKAFDTLNFDILLRKLQHYGIDGNSLNLIKSYLTNRFQYVQFENSDSSLLEVKTGIPQGSILGPLFFSILINDLVNCSTKVQFLMYADDTTIYFNLNDFPLINREIEINSELEKVNTWLKLNKLAINVDKSKCMFFQKRRSITPLKFLMNNRAIDVVHNFNYLGIMLDANMSWKSHIAMVSNKLSRINGILHRLKYLYPQNILITLYKSLFIPHINYGSLLWGHAGESIDKIQKKAIRTITYSSYIAHSEPLLKSLNLLKVKDLFNLKILKFLFNLYHNKLPPYFNNYRLDLEKIETPYALRLHPLPVPRVSHAYAEAGLVYQLVIMQNKITVSDNLISRRIHDPNYSLVGFNQLLINKMLDNYSYDCPLAICHTCGRT